MTVSSVVPVNTYIGNSSSKKFDFDFLIETESELVVQHTDKYGVTTILKEGIDYSIKEIGKKDGSYIIFPLETSSYGVLTCDEKISLLLSLVIKQESEFRNSSYFNFNILEWTFDYIVRILQILNRKLERCVKVKEGDNISPDEIVNDIKKSEKSAKEWYLYSKEKALESQDSANLAKEWAVKTEGKIQDDDYSSKYYAQKAADYSRQAESYSTLRYNVFCVNTGVIANRQPSFLVLENNMLKTVGCFDITTADGTIYTLEDEIKKDISNLENGKYNVFINPIEKIISVNQGNIYYDVNSFCKLKEGDYFLNTSKVPYDFEKKLQNGFQTELKEVFAGVLKINGSEKTLYLNQYNKNIIEIERDKKNKYNFFDVIPKDHKLSYEGKEGLELLGEYVYKESADGRYGYPEFYEKCIEEYREGTSNTSEVSGITIKIHSNGHKFYDIKDKSFVDKIYQDTGAAWYYGIDEANQRILLPRNDWYFAKLETAPVVGNGLTLGLKYGVNSQTGGLFGFSVNNSSGTSLMAGNYGKPLNELVTGVSYLGQYASVGVTDDPEKSGLQALLNKAKKEQNLYIYMVVGNTTVIQAKTKVTEVSASENDTIPLFTGMYFDFTPNHVSWLKAGTEASGKIYESAYNELVKVLRGEETKYGESFKVIKETDKLPDNDYSLYWTIDEENQTFTTPLKISILNNTYSLYFKVANAVDNLELINAGEVLEELNSKISVKNCKAYITETYQNDTSGYRVWSDGFCEQWGEIEATRYTGGQVMFLKPYRDTNYQAYTQHKASQYKDDGGVGEMSCVANSPEYMTLYNGVNIAYTSRWFSFGYLKEGSF